MTLGEKQVNGRLKVAPFFEEIDFTDSGRREGGRPKGIGYRCVKKRNAASKGPCTLMTSASRGGVSLKTEEEMSNELLRTMGRGY